ncbi:HEAT repeat domain-containing protein [Reichenbachiella ulvae]|uniref:HEAT repeat domain-containing protein n=1 Tax=Reichenbachiella ulvae TaxID=2980104 RepID=A0ABT3CU16_9BACT|nr:HEAT repeat domain-containing protein [Reichenbachiella ulvae]MCV9386970.1 HEAT repeat domain-containing protein [Reichenbachiella ulvae]
MNKVSELKKQFESNDFQTKLSTSDQLANIGSDESLSFLLEQLKSENNRIRNAAVLGLMETRNQKFFKPILDRITELGFNEEIGTLVYALENFNCSNVLKLICELYLYGNAEVQMSTSSILADQKFKEIQGELSNVKQLLNEHGRKIEDFKIQFEITE